MHTRLQLLWKPFFATAAVAGLLLSGCGSQSAMPGTPPVINPPSGSSSCTTSNVTITHTSGSANAAQMVFLDPAKYPQAMCNDGTPRAYVLRPGSGAAASRWVISLQGGSQCIDQSTCSARAVSDPEFISSNPYRRNPPAALQLSGIQSSSESVNLDFFDANNVATWNFQGHAILSAIMQDLKANHGLSSATEVLFTGESAGGVGVWVNVNVVAKLVHATARFVASSDAGFQNPTGNFNPGGSPPNYAYPAPPDDLASPGITLWNGTGDSVCASSATTPAEQRKCYSAAQLLGTGGTIALPMLVIEAQKDVVQLNNNGIPQADIDSGDFTIAESGYISYFASQMRAGLSSTNANVSIFSPDELLHTETNNDMLLNTSYSFPNGAFTLQQVNSSWYKNPCTVQRDIAN
jgi:hypothetical protein